nr:stage III sporulation protein AF [uncultured Blautia sp.]
MKEEITGLVRNLAVFYIIFTSVIQLVPDKKYERYVRNFMALLLIYMVCTAVFSIMGKTAQITETFSEEYQKETARLDQQQGQELQLFYLNREYEKEIQKKILEILENTGIKQAEVTVHIEGENLSVVICLQKNITEEQERRLEDALWQELEIGKEKYQIITGGNGKTAMDTAAASGTSSDSGSNASIQAYKRNYYCTKKYSG